MTYRVMVQIVGMGGAAFTVESLDEPNLLLAVEEAAKETIKNCKQFEATGRSDANVNWRPDVDLRSAHA